MGGLHLAWRAAATIIAVLLCACGGGSSVEAPASPPTAGLPDPPVVTGIRLSADVHWQPPSSAIPASGNYVYLESAPGDPMGQGITRLYTDDESAITYSYAAGSNQISVGNPDRQWAGVFDLGTYPRQPGFYGNVSGKSEVVGQYASSNVWTTEWRQCDNRSGWFVVDAIEQDSDGLRSIVLRFAQYCEGASAPLRGKLRWSRAAQRVLPIMPPPATLWEPAAGTVPTAGNYLYIESDAGDYVGQGRSRVFRAGDAAIDVRLIDGGSKTFYNVVAVRGLESWAGSLIGAGRLELAPGYYPGVQRVPYDVPGIGAMEWATVERRCSVLNGWYTVDRVQYYERHIVHLELRFEQRCAGSQAALRGKLRWSLLEALPPEGPQLVGPVGLWQPPVGTVPASGDYVYLESDAADPVGAGSTRLYTEPATSLTGVPYGSAFHTRVQGDALWTGDVRAMEGIESLQPGYYAQVVPMTQRQGTVGSLAWTRNGVSCAGGIQGWINVESVDRTPEGAIAGLVYRFEQRCTGAAGALRGQVRWTAPAAAVTTPAALLAALWQPPAEALPSTGNFVYVESDYRDLLGAGRAYLYTPDDAGIRAQGRVAGAAYNPRANFEIGTFDGNERWVAAFQAPAGAARLEPGLYGNAVTLRAATATPNAMLEVQGRALVCGDLLGWFAIDRVTYVGDAVDAIEARFEQSCRGSEGSLRGKFRWSAADVRPPRGPIQPIPSTLWQPPASAVPASGSYVYLESEYGDFVGAGRTRLFTPTDVTIGAEVLSGDRTWVSVRIRQETVGGDFWDGVFAAMDGVAPIQPGYYENVLRWGSGNPMRPEMDWNGRSRGCNRVSGWFAIDSLTVSGGRLDAVELRFEQHCEYGHAPMRGKVRWSR